MGRIILFVIIITVAFAVTGCPEEMVGAPCVSETDNRKFSTELLSAGTNSEAKIWSIETGSVQCATHLCLTQTKQNPDAKRNNDDGQDRHKDCLENSSAENCGAVYNEDGSVKLEPVLLKFSFCSCRCEDGDGNRKADNPDKFVDLCECPPSSYCEPVLDKIAGVGDETSAISEKLYGGYCVPQCIHEPCEIEDANMEGLGEVCTPSTNSEEPWLWSCKQVVQ